MKEETYDDYDYNEDFNEDFDDNFNDDWNSDREDFDDFSIDPDEIYDNLEWVENIEDPDLQDDFDIDDMEDDYNLD